MFNFLFKKEENNIIKYKPKECVKKSKLKLNNHQKRVIERIFLKDGILLVHSTGTGKTLTAVGVSECLLDNGIVDNVVVSAPRVLVENFHKELKAYGVIQNYDKYHVNTYIKTLRFLGAGTFQLYIIIISYYLWKKKLR